MQRLVDHYHSEDSPYLLPLITRSGKNEARQYHTEQNRLGRALSADERFALLEQLTLRLSVGNKLNLLVWDGTYLYAHSNYAGTLHYCHPTPDSVLLSTHPLDSVAPGEWQPLPFLRLVVYRDGQEVYTGIPLSQEYFDPEENFEYKELDYANL